MDIVTSAAEREEILGPPWELNIRQVRSTLHAGRRARIAASPLCMVATSVADDSCVPPRGGPAGQFLTVAEKTVVISERPGNRRTGSFRNIPQKGTAVGVIGSPYTTQLETKVHGPLLGCR